MTSVQLSRADFDELFASLRTWGRWGERDERGALHHLGPEQVAAAAALVHFGRTVSLAHDLDTDPGPDNPRPVAHRLTGRADSDAAAGGQPRMNTDYVGTDYHGKSVTHLDALCHCTLDGRLYNGVSTADAITDEGGSFGSVLTYRDGLAGRGVLLDVPRVRKVDYLEPGTGIGAADLARVCAEQSSPLRRGDLVVVRTGARRRRDELGAWDPSNLSAGLLPDAVAWLAGHEIALLGGDGDSDTRPSPVEGVDSPVHALVLTALGMPLVDNLSLEPLAAECTDLGRWEFLLVLAPLRLPGGTGSPVNPVAVL